jgi:hypothetical protein
MVIGFALSLLGFAFYFLSPCLFDESLEMGRNGSLILFAFGWALSGGSFFFNLGLEAEKSRGRE